MTFLRFIPTVLILAMALTVSAKDVRGQDPQAPAPPPAVQEQVQQVEVTEELLERFVDVYPHVLEASQQAQAELAATTDSEQAQAIQARAEETIMAVLDEEEMSPVEYRAVLMALRDDEELRESFTRMLEEAQVDPGA